MTYPPFEPRDPRLDQTAILYPDRPDLYPPGPPLTPPRRRRHWGRRLVTAISLLLVIVLVAVTAGGFYLQSRLKEVRRVTPAGLTSASGRAMTVLMVGSDSRTGLEPGQESFGTISGQRSDAIMLLRVDPSKDQATVLSIPRDLYLPIAGTGKSNRINTAYAGGPDRLIQTITAALGIPIDHYVEVNFDGFRGIVDAIGGLNINFPAPARDILAELNVPTAGCVHLDGRQGLAYVRSRHYESLENGRWKTDPTSDFGRINRQQDFIRRMIKKAISAGVRNPFTANKLLDSFVDDVVLDGEMGTTDLVRLGLSFRSAGDGGIEMLTIPTVGARVGGNSVLRMKEPDAGQMIDRFLNPPPNVQAPASEPVTPGDVKVQVLNGSGRPGEAGSTLTRLGGIGFVGAGTSDAAARTNSLIRHAKGAGAKAALLQGYVIGASEIQEDASVKGSDVVLVTGQSFGGIRTTPEAPAAPPPDPAAECLA